MWSTRSRMRSRQRAEVDIKTSADRTTRARRDASGLGIASIFAALAAYALVVVGTRAYGPADFAPVSVLWAWWMATAAVVTFPLQHWLIRARIAEQSVAQTLWRSFGGVVLLGLCVGGLAMLLDEALFSDSSVTYPALVLITPIGAWCIGTSRGVLASSNRYDLVSLSIGTENLVRLGVGIVVVVASGSVVSFALSLPAGYLVALFVVFARNASDGSRSSPAPEVRSNAALGGLVGASLVNQLIQSGTPLMVLVIGGSDAELTTAFVLLLLARIPYFFAATLSIRLTEELTELYLTRAREVLARFIRAVLVMGAGTMVAAGLLGVALGPSLMSLGLGSDFETSGPAVAVFAASGVAAVGLLLLTLLLTAEGHSWHGLLAALAGAFVGVAVLLTRAGDDAVVAAGLAFLVAMTVSATCAAVLAVRNLKDLEVRDASVC